MSQPSFSKLWLPQWGQILFWRAWWLTTWLDKSACIWMFRQSFLLSTWVITVASQQESVSTVYHYWSSLTYLWLILSSQGVNLLGISVSQTFISWLNWSTVKKTVRVKNKECLEKKLLFCFQTRLTTLFLLLSIICVHMACWDTLRNHDLCQPPV